ncbi:YdcF family protein [Pacificimonas sp. WHA3]|uniref:YdcF family protein n=1 Tax=Pacificimonas pallii TaxID=2827236 RepID=A0ABS6SES7_9SPHN|nr:YdcF family protein [Pacificimonas pallii]MBV7256894.1 YdcF family protein [Pacificimonas pallii]
MNYLLWGIFGPAGWPVWCFMAGTYALFTWRERLAKFLTGLGTLLAIGLLFLPTGPYLVLSLEEQFAWELPEQAPDNILMLTGGEHIRASARTGRVETGFHGDRLSATLELAKMYPGAKIWVAGFGEDGVHPASDTDITSRYWQIGGVPADRITEVEGTGDTCQNLTGYSAQEPTGSTLLVTSGFHMPRSMACAAAAGMDVIPYPVDAQTGLPIRWAPNIANNAYQLSIGVHEYVGLLWYRLRGRL